MKRFVLLLLVVMLVIPVIVSCKSEETYSDFGLFANNYVEHEGWIYYSEWHTGDLYKIKPSGEQKTRIGDFQTYYFNIYEDRIYYLDAVEWNIMCSAKLDGSDKTILYENEFAEYCADKMQVVDGWVYFFIKDSVLYRVKTDGTELTVLSKGNEHCIDFSIGKEWIYFSVMKPIDNKWSTVLFKMRMDGTQRTQLMQENSLLLDYDCEWIYYVDTAGKSIGELNTDGQSICKIRFDGSEKQKLTDSDMLWNGFFKVIGDWIYYEDFGDDIGLYKVNTDSGERVKISDDIPCRFVDIWSNWMIKFDIDYSDEPYKPYLQIIRIGDNDKYDGLIDKIIEDLPPEIEIRKYE